MPGRSLRLCCFVLLVAASHAVFSAPMPEVKSYKIDAEYIQSELKIRARADIRFLTNTTQPDTLVCYLHGEFEVTEVLLDEVAEEFSQEVVFYPYEYSMVARQVRIPLEGRELPEILSVSYEGYCNRSSAQAVSSYMHVDAEGVRLRAYGYSLWFPIFLEAGSDPYRVSFPSVVLRTPEHFRSVFTGNWIEDRVENGMRSSYWRADDIMLWYPQWTARKYEVMNDGGCFVYTLKDSQSMAMASEVIEFTRRLDSLFRSCYGDVELGSQLHIMQMPKYGDISSGNVVGISSSNWQIKEGEPFSSTTLAHELVHPFVQREIAKSDPFYALVIEGFPSYFYTPIMAEILGEGYYQEYLRDRIETGYLKKKRDGTDQWDRLMPPEKPITEISADDISKYKDEFVLSDRVKLMLNYIRALLGRDRFFDFTRELFGHENLDREIFESTVLSYLPNAGEDLHIWLDTNEFPERFHLKNLPQDGAE